jgi:hypothetical protein
MVRDQSVPPATVIDEHVYIAQKPASQAELLQNERFVKPTKNFGSFGSHTIPFGASSQPCRRVKRKRSQLLSNAFANHRTLTLLPSSWKAATYYFSSMLPLKPSFASAFRTPETCLEFFLRAITPTLPR